MGPMAVSQPASLIARCSAAALDAALVSAVAFAVVQLARVNDRYVPFELTFLLAWIAQAVLLTTCTGRTMGKWALGLTVRRDRGEPVGAFRALLRETVARLPAWLPLGLGVWWIGIRPSKRGWHDHLVGTIVVCDPASARRRWWGVRVCTFAMMVALASLVVPRAWLYARAARMTPAPLPPRSRLAPPRDARTVSADGYAGWADWLNAHGAAPEEYAVAVAKEHQLTIFGEFHHVADDLRFLVQIIPDLYHRAGVRCLGMEALVARDNEALLKLVTAPAFDRDHAVVLARHEAWRAWGSREYLDVLEAVWRLNHSLPLGEPPLRVIGLDREWDMPSWSLVGAGDDAKPGPWWERLRLLRVLPDLPLLARRDELMAWELEREAFVTQQRAVAWVGAGHAYVDYAQPFVFGDPTSGRRCRMGAILRRKYGEQVCHLRLHDSAYEGPALVALIEAVQALRGNKPIALDVAASPFATLRDGAGLEDRRDPGVCFADFVTGYLYLKPVSAQRHCAWESGFITQSMFLRDKPYYEAQTGKRLPNAQEADAAFRQKWEQ